MVNPPKKYIFRYVFQLLYYNFEKFVHNMLFFCSFLIVAMQQHCC